MYPDTHVSAVEYFASNLLTSKDSRDYCSLPTVKYLNFGRLIFIKLKAKITTLKRCKQLRFTTRSTAALHMSIVPIHQLAQS